jgi:hypothetical protein
MDVAMRPVPHSPPAKDTMTERRSTDLTKTIVPLPFMVGIIVTAISIAAGIWSIRTDVQLMNMRMEYEAKLRLADKETFDQAFKALEAKIDAASNRNAALAAYQELSQQKSSTKR